MPALLSFENATALVNKTIETLPSANDTLIALGNATTYLMNETNKLVNGDPANQRYPHGQTFFEAYGTPILWTVGVVTAVVGTIVCCRLGCCKPVQKCCSSVSECCDSDSSNSTSRPSANIQMVDGNTLSDSQYRKAVNEGRLPAWQR